MSTAAIAEIKQEIAKNRAAMEKALACSEESVLAVSRAMSEFRRLEQNDFVDSTRWKVFKAGRDELTALSIRLNQILNDSEMAG